MQAWRVDKHGWHSMCQEILGWRISMAPYWIWHYFKCSFPSHLPGLVGVVGGWMVQGDLEEGICLIPLNINLLPTCLDLILNQSFEPGSKSPAGRVWFFLSTCLTSWDRTNLFFKELSEKQSKFTLEIHLPADGSSWKIRRISLATELSQHTTHI